jgi:alanine racemase
VTATLTVDLDAFAANLVRMRERVAPAELMLVVKDDAYGHGLEPIVSRAHESGVRWIGAFDVASGVRVRTVLGDDARVFAWMVSGIGDARAAVDATLDLGIGDPAALEDVAEAAGRAGRSARVHLKIDTGLHRNGVRPEEWPAFVARAVQLEQDGRIEVVGVWSHIAEASDDEDDAAREQFLAAIAAAREQGVRSPVRHLAASAASFARPEFRFDLVRVGAFCYGIRPAGGPSDADLGITPVASLDAPVVSVHTDGVRIGIGSADGLPSTLSGRIDVTTPDGRRRVRRIDDLETTVDPWPGAAAGQRVRIYGTGAAGATDLAETIDTIGEEIALRLSPLIERRYR